MMKLEMNYKAKQSGKGIDVSTMRRELARLVSKLDGSLRVNSYTFTLATQKDGFKKGD
jgi:hypothetical protein